MRSVRCVLVVLLLILPACRRDKPPLAINPSLARLVPVDTVALAGFRMNEVRNSPLYRKWAARTGGRIDEFARETGFDPRKDVEQFLIASDGKNMLVLAKGKFEKQMERHGGGYGVVFPDKSTAVAGPLPAVKAAIDRGKKDGIPQALREKLATLPPESQVWGVALGIDPHLYKMIPETGNLSNLRPVLASVDSVAVGMDLRSGVKMEFTGVCRAAQDAKVIHDGLRGLIGMGRLSTPDNAPEMLRFYDGIQVTQEQQTVRVRADIPEEILERVLSRMGSLANPRP